LLARSPYFQDWRRAVQAVYDAADNHALKTSGAAVSRRIAWSCSTFLCFCPPMQPAFGAGGRESASQ